MPRFSVRPLTPDHDFGARIGGLTLDSVTDEALRADLRSAFDERGVLVFEDVEPTAAMQISLSEIFGPLQPHAFKNVPVVGDKAKPGIVDFNASPDDPDVFVVDGAPLASWVPWHFDACYTQKLNRAGLLRPLTIPAEGGYTGFVDGIQLYNALSPEWRVRLTDLEVLYHPWLMFMNLRFGRPQEFEVRRFKQSKQSMIDGMKAEPRAIHPAVWKRPSGEHVLHVSPWQADGLVGMETPEGDELLHAICREIEAKMNPYFHAWRPRDMVVWDNWRFLHSCAGHPPEMPRHMHRTTIEGDYGLGRFENGQHGKDLAEAMV